MSLCTHLRYVSLRSFLSNAILIVHVRFTDVCKYVCTYICTYIITYLLYNTHMHIYSYIHVTTTVFYIYICIGSG